MVRRARVRHAAPSRAARVTRLGGRPRALQVLLIALGLLLGQGATLLHLLMVPHTTCEHGELVEVHSSPRTPTLEAEAKHPGVEAARPGRAEHEHCDGSARLHRVEAVGPAVGEATLLRIEPSATLREHGETRPVELLALAPKSSPPSA